MPALHFATAGWALLVLAVAWAAALGVALWAYAAPEPPLPRGARPLLAALRTLALGGLATLLVEPHLVVARPNQRRPSLPVLVDGSTSMAWPVAAGDTLTRAAAAEDLFESIRPVLDARFEVVRREVTGGASASATRLGQSLVEALAGGERPPFAVVVSDGAANLGIDPVEAARDLGVPLLTYAVSSDSVVVDAAIVDGVLNRRVFRGRETPVVVTVRSTLDEPATTRLVLRHQGVVVGGRAVALPEGPFETAVRLTHTPEALGLEVLQVELEPVEGEVMLGNNARLLVAEVVEERQQVLFLAGELSWDAGFLNRAIAGNRTMEATFFQRQAPGGSFEPVGDGRLAGLPETAAELLPFVAVVMVGALGELPPAVERAILTYAQEGGGVVWIPGHSTNQLERALGTPLGQVLPVELAPGGVGGWAACRLTAPGQRHPITRASATSERWGALPPIHVPAPLRAQLAAEVLVEGQLTGGRHPVALVAAGPLGRGRAVCVAGVELWRWDLLLRSTAAEGVLPRMVAEAVQWVSAGRQATPLEVFPVEPAFLTGEDVWIGARLVGAGLEPISNAEVVATLTRPTGQSAAPIEVKLLPAGAPGEYRGSVPATEPGAFVLRGRAVHGDASWESPTGAVLIDSTAVEMLDPAARPALMRRLAQRTGGAWLGDAPGVVLEAWLGDAQLDRRTAQIPLWNHPWVFAALVGALALEWLLRRRWGLA